MDVTPTNADSPHRRSQPRRRWFQYRLRSLLLLMLVIGVGMSWLVSIKKRGDRQRATVEAIQKSGGCVAYDYQINPGLGHFANPGNTSIPGAEPPGPAWLRQLFGEDCFANVISATINTDTDVSVLNDLAQLQDLKLTRTVFTYTLPNLLNYRTAERSLSDNDWAQIGKLTQLRSLNVSGWCVTDAGLKRVGGLTQLQYLDLALNGITDKGLASLEHMTKLRYLNLSHNPKISDAGLVYLKQMTQLEELCFDHNNIDDDGLEHLKGLTHLKSLGLWTTGVSDDGITKLQAVLPNCTIDFGFE